VPARRGDRPPTAPATALVDLLAGWDAFADTSIYDGAKSPSSSAPSRRADLARAELAEFRHLDRLTAFADNLVPHASASTECCGSTRT